MLKDNGNKKPIKIIKCPNCKSRLNVEELIQNGYLEKLAGVTICNCPNCDEQWEQK